MQHGPLNPSRLPSGTMVGPWRVVEPRGRGAYGSVYLAEGVAPLATGRVALKVSNHPREERFGREAELLSRLRHPCVPRLIDQGQWLSPTGQPHPYLAMELVDGIPLYEWARAFCPSSRQVLEVLAQVARALEASHAAGGVHRDVKGDNVLVRPADRQAFLIDFGSGYYRGATSLTWQVFPPGTPPYRSPEAYRFTLNIRHEPVKLYSPGPADDLFALGVTGYMLVTGEYPPSPQPLDAQFHGWTAEGPGPRPARELNPLCGEELSALISRMLSRQPEARGNAAALASALEQAAQAARREADVPLFPRKTPLPFPAVQPVPRRSGWPWLAAAGLAGPVLLGAVWLLRTPSAEEAEPAPVARQEEESTDAGTVALGASALTERVESSHVPSGGTSIALDLPAKPFPGQLRPDASGRCPRNTMVPINGGCWIQTNVDGKRCDKSSYVYQGRCYEPAVPLPRLPTSGPTEPRDGG